MQDLAATAATELAAPTTRHEINIREFVNPVIVIRDWLQTYYGNNPPPENPLLLKAIQLLRKAGIWRFEAPSGAQPQVDVLRGRSPATSIKAQREAAGPDAELRDLFRSLSGLALELFHLNDIVHKLRFMLDNGGAKQRWDKPGSPVVIDFFEAQNRARNIIPVVNRFTQMCDDEKYNGEAEILVCIKPNEKFSKEKHLAIWRNILFNAPASLDFTAEELEELGLKPYTEAMNTSRVTRIRYKDMNGFSNDHGNGIEECNAAAMVEVMEIIAAEFYQKTGRKIGIGLHTHDSGFAAGANHLAAKTAIINKMTKGDASPVSGIWLDFMAGGAAFQDLGDFFKALEKDIGQNPKVHNLGFTKAQGAAYDEAVAAIREFEKVFGYCKTDNRISHDDLRYAQIPGGAITATYLYTIMPTAKLLLDNGIGKNAEEALKIAERLTIEAFPVVIAEMGEPMMVTPGAYNASLCVRDFLEGMIKAGHVRQLIETKGLDLSKPRSEVPLPQEEKNALKQFRSSIGAERSDSRAALDYFRADMLIEQSPEMLAHMCAIHRQQILPAVHTDSPFAKLFGQALTKQNYPALKEALMQIDATNKDEAIKVFLAQGFSKRLSIIAAESHFGKKDKLPSNFGLDEAMPLVLQKIADLKKARKFNRSDDQEAGFVGLLSATRTSVGVLIRAEFEKWCEFPAERYPAVWAAASKFIDRFTWNGAVDAIEAMAADGVADFNEYRNKPGLNQAGRVASNIGDGHVPGFPGGPNTPANALSLA